MTEVHPAPISDPEIILAVHNVSRRYGNTYALENISFEVYRGEVFAILGPNGAGKTTMAHLLQGDFTPDTGEIRYYKKGEATSELSTNEIGYFPGDSSIFKTLALNRVLYHAATRRGMSPADAQEATDKWLERLELSDRANTSLANLSRGNQQKVQFAEAVLHSPRVVFLDEPFANLDPINQELFVTLIREVQANGTTILLSDHQMTLVERLANRICILHEGLMVAQGSLEELRALSQVGVRVRVRVIDPSAPVDLHALLGHSGVRRVERTASGEIRLLTYDDTIPIEVLNFVKKNLRISEILAEPAGLHDIYVQCLTQGIQQTAAPAEG